MRDVESQLRNYWSEITADLPEPTLEAARQQRVGSGAVRPLQERHAARRGQRWVLVAVAVAGLVLIGGVLWMLLGEGNESRVTDDRSGTTSSTAGSTTTAGSAATPVPVGWDSVLTDYRSRQAPPAAVCPPGTDPDQAGRSDQQRPHSISHAGLTAAFDRHAGRIVYVDALGETWTFDVCTNTWHEMDPVGAPYRDERDLFDAGGAVSGVIGDMVYDVDSDRTVVFGSHAAYAYDATTNTWIADGYPGVSDGFHPIGAVYDPVSGLIVTTTMLPDDLWELWAYDVDGGVWTLVGTVPLERSTPCCTHIDLLGYSPRLDRLILTTYSRLEEVTVLLDPRTGTVELVHTPSPQIDLIWPSRSYGIAGDTVFVNGWTPAGDRTGTHRICGLDAGDRAWTTCLDGPTGPGSQIYSGYAAMVDDPINERLVLIYGRYGEFWALTEAAVWAIDLRTGDPLTLVAPAARPADSIAIVLAGLEGYDGLAVDSWVLPTELTEERFAFAGMRSGEIHLDPFSAVHLMHPQDATRYIDILETEVASFEPGAYRLIIEAYQPSGPMRYGCEMPIEMIEGQPLTITISELPRYSGDGWHWTPFVDQLRYPECPASVRIDTGG